MANSVDHEYAIIVKAKCDASSDLTTECPGGVRWNLFKQPADASAISEPYCVFEINPLGDPILSTGSTDVYKRQVVFKVFGNEAAAATACGRLRAIFHKQTLTDPTGGKFLACLESDGGRASIPMWARDSLMKWQAEFVCEIWCQFG